MELRQLVSFYHVAQLRSVSKAARTLALGQPTVTTHLRKLEDAGYVEIEKRFEGRKPQTRVHLTAAGRNAWLDYLARMRALLDAAE
mgnify:CR=1 FL=1